MQKTIYEDYKYSMQDTTRIYVGCKYTFKELLQADDIWFKFRAIVRKYIMDEAKPDPEDTLETHLYYLEDDSFLAELYDQMKAKVKINILVEKKQLFGGKTMEYTTKQMPVSELVKMSPAVKEKYGVVIQEISVSKLAIMNL